MLSISVFAFVIFLSTECSHGFYYGDLGAIHNARQPMCPSFTKPCRLRVSLRSEDGSEHETISTETCTCSHPHNCSDDWTRTDGHVVSRQVISTTYNMTLQMMFCKAVEPKTFCRQGDISLVVKGPMLMPQDIASYNCRCRSQQPLLLDERSIGEDRLMYHKYVCADHKPICSRTEPCLTIRQTSTDYNCKCSLGFQCRTLPSPVWEDELNYGYCSP